MKRPTRTNDVPMAIRGDAALQGSEREIHPHRFATLPKRSGPHGETISKCYGDSGPERYAQMESQDE